MKKIIAAVALACAGCTPALAATMASQPWVANRIAEAVSALPAPDYTTGNTQLVATIEATAPAPGDYANVSNRAMEAVQPDALASALAPLESSVAGKVDASSGEATNLTLHGVLKLWDFDGYCPLVIHPYYSGQYFWFENGRDGSERRSVYCNFPTDRNYADLAFRHDVAFAAAAATNALAAALDGYMPLTGGTMQGDIDMGGGMRDGEATDSAFLIFDDLLFGYGYLGMGFGIYQGGGGSLTAKYLFNGDGWGAEYGVDEDVMTRADLADALGDIPAPPDLTPYATHEQATNAAIAVAAASAHSVAVAATNYADGVAVQAYDSAAAYTDSRDNVLWRITAVNHAPSNEVVFVGRLIACTSDTALFYGAIEDFPALAAKWDPWREYTKYYFCLFYVPGDISGQLRDGLSYQAPTGDFAALYFSDAWAISQDDVPGVERNCIDFVRVTFRKVAIPTTGGGTRGASAAKGLAGGMGGRLAKMRQRQQEAEAAAATNAVGTVTER